MSTTLKIVQVFNLATAGTQCTSDWKDSLCMWFGLFSLTKLLSPHGLLEWIVLKYLWFQGSSTCSKVKIRFRNRTHVVNKWFDNPRYSNCPGKIFLNIESTLAKGVRGKSNRFSLQILCSYTLQEKISQNISRMII